MLVQTLEKMQADIHKMYDEIIETGQIKEKESPVDGEAYTDIEELQHDYLAMIKTVVDMLDGAKYLWQNSGVSRRQSGKPRQITKAGFCYQNTN